MMASSVGLGVMGGIRLPLIQSSTARKARLGAVQVGIRHVFTFLEALIL